MSLRAGLANRIWRWSVCAEHQAYLAATLAVAQVQESYLLGLIARSAQTEFGRRYDFAALRSVADYQAAVPLQEYDDLTPDIERIAAGVQGVLTPEPVLLLESTSGSTAARKLIPYTASLQGEFQRSISAWVADLFSAYPDLVNGPAYWSVSPVARQGERTTGGIPIGFEEDTEYLGRVIRLLSRALMAVPGEVRFIEEMAAFRYVTLLFLLSHPDLRLISVWNPTFLSLLMEPLPGWHESLAKDIATGRVTPPALLPSGLTARLTRHLKPNPARAHAILEAFAADGSAGEINARLWPQLGLLSCWTDANAGPYVPALQALFPQARLQGKGLIATEGIVSFPMNRHSGSALAIRSHFLEFIPEGGGPVRLAHELEPGGVYSVALTTGGGLYRYRLHDLISVVGHLNQCPLIQFAGKAAHISDWFGEKLNEYHVAQSLCSIWTAYAIQPAFAMLSCEAHGSSRAYTLFVEAPDTTDEELRPVGTTLERALTANFHYKYCRDLGQLGPVCLFRIKQGGLASYLAGCQRHGQRAGDIKPLALNRWDGWVDRFDGSLC